MKKDEHELPQRKQLPRRRPHNIEEFDKLLQQIAIEILIVVRIIVLLVDLAGMTMYTIVSITSFSVNC